MVGGGEGREGKNYGAGAGLEDREIGKGGIRLGREERLNVVHSLYDGLTAIKNCKSMCGIGNLQQNGICVVMLNFYRPNWTRDSF